MRVREKYQYYHSSTSLHLMTIPSSRAIRPEPFPAVPIERALAGGLKKESKVKKGRLADLIG